MANQRMLHPSLLTFVWGAVKGKNRGERKGGMREGTNKQGCSGRGKLQPRMPEMLDIATQENCQCDYRETLSG